MKEHYVREVLNPGIALLIYYKLRRSPDYVLPHLTRDILMTFMQFLYNQ